MSENRCGQVSAQPFCKFLNAFYFYSFLSRDIFQMAMLEPKLAILDETDSGLDIDALRIVSDGVNKLKTPDNAYIVITHYQRLLDYIVPDVVHVLYDGRIIKTGDKSLALELEEKGYEWITKNSSEWETL